MVNLDYGGLQGGFILFSVNSVGDVSPIMCKSERLHRHVKSTMESESLTKVGAAEAAFWVTKLYSEVSGDYIDRNINNVIPIECFSINYSVSPILYRR